MASMASSSTPSSSRPSSRSRRKTAENWDDDFEFALPSKPRPPAIKLTSQKENEPESSRPTPKSALLGRTSPDSVSSWSDSPPRSPTRLAPRHPPISPRATTSASTDLPRSSSTSEHPLLPHDVPLPPTVRRRSNSNSKTKLIKRHPSASFAPIVNPSTTSLSSLSNHHNPQLRHAPSAEVMPPPPIPSRRPSSRSQVRVSGIPFSPSQDDMKEGKKKGFWKRLSGVPNDSSGQRRRRSSSVGSPGKSSEVVPPLPPLPPSIRSSSSTSVASHNGASSPAQPPTSILRRSHSSLAGTGSTPPPSSSFSRPATPPRALSSGFHLPSPVHGSPYLTSQMPNSASSLPPSSSHPTPLRHDSDTETEVDGTTPRRKRIRPVSAAPAPRQTPASTGFPTATLRRISSMSKKHGRRLSGGFKFGTTSSTSSGESKMLETVVGSPSKPIVHRPEPSTEIDLRDIRIDSVSAPSSSFRGSSQSGMTTDKLDKLEKESRRQSWNDFVIPSKVLERQRELKQEIGAVKKFAGGLERVGKLVDLHQSLRSKITVEQLAIFNDLDSEYGQWLEMATVLIEVGATGTQDASPRARRVTLASDEAKQAGELLRQTDTFGPRKTSMPDPVTADTSFHEQLRASTGRQDLSKRQLEVLRTMLRTPVPPSTARRIPVTPQRAIDLSFPSPSDSDYLDAPSPQTASSLARPRRPTLKSRRSSKAGLAGLKDFLKSLKGVPPGQRSSRSPTKSAFSRDATPVSPLQSSFPTSQTSLSVSTTDDYVSISPPRRIPSPEKASKRPSIRSIFRTSSGNWSDLVRPPTTPTTKTGLERRSSRSSRKSQEAEEADPGVPRSSRRIPKTPTSAFGFTPPWKSPREALSNGETVRPRRKSGIMGLGNPGSPAQAQRGVVVSNPDPVFPREIDGVSRSASAPTIADMSDDLIVALTPENLPVLLDYLKQCESKLGEWKVRVETVIDLAGGNRSSL
ncbi:hypothetical protein BD324DRAFT_651945 [Kockovaella imperatae]|uniref:Uncharacterized protein n=1 Tax=Kockovaella imperatae TaxID=4999 RepID=A0A1Y1UDC5_9TREE|nr:hypothetical protein BD324DRAFT_651945 [Kockovaella imperatae]ORX36041.1 hypothetical protein BD324DRAFT_651945 [Kockovaella imperatae]